MALTIGQVSGILNLGIVLIQLALPLGIVLVLSTLLSETNSAATWTLSSYMYQRTLWPTLLRTDPTSRRHVRKRVRILSIFSTLSVILVLVTAVVTPLGLWERIQLGEAGKVGQWEYLKDPSPFGEGTTPEQRGKYRYHRICANGGHGCPGTKFLAKFEETDEELLTDIRLVSSTVETKVPGNITRLFDSVNEVATTLVSPLDIEYRVFEEVDSTLDNSSLADVVIDEGKPYIRGRFQMLQSIILSNRYDLIEGLVVDTIHGGIGFRNHTVPSNIPNGAEWIEDILWAQPVTSCVDSGIHVEYNVPRKGFSDLFLQKVEDPFLVDDGGIASLKSPSNQKPPPVDFKDAQQNLDLENRAKNSAWIMHYFAMKGLGMSFTNLTSEPGKRYKISLTGMTAPPLTPLAISMTTLFTTNLPWSRSIFRKTTDPEVDDCIYPGRNDSSLANVAINCGRIFGAAKPVNPNPDDSPMQFRPGALYKQPVYTCATTIKLSVQSLTLRARSQPKSLTDLEVVSLKNSSLPITWAAESPFGTLIRNTPLWGIISPKLANNPSIETLQRDHLYLPSGQRFRSLEIQDSMASNGLLAILDELYALPIASSGHFADYMGKSSFPMLQKWRELSETPEKAAMIPNLIWTDVAANVLTTGKGNGLKIPPAKAALEGVGEGRSKKNVRVREYRKEIAYKLPYALPGVLTLLVFLFVWFSAMLGCLLGRTGTRKLRQLGNRMSLGRAVLAFALPRASRVDAPTEEWAKVAGGVRLDLKGEVEYAHGGLGNGSEIQLVTSPGVSPGNGREGLLKPPL